VVSLQVDPVPDVREIFAKKLHKGLNKGIPHKCLPLDFMGYYALGGRETDKRLVGFFFVVFLHASIHFPFDRLSQTLKTNIETDVNRRREYVKTFASGK
jgi:sister chromatid cohesion protein PDS5